MPKIISARGRAKSTAVTVRTRFTRAEMIEISHCSIDPIYFINTYVKYNHPIHGAMQMVLQQHQLEYVDALVNNTNLIAMMPRQAGMTHISIAFLIWEALFRTDQKIHGMGLNVGATKIMCDAMTFIVNQLPDFLRPGIKVMRRTEIVFDNGSSLHISVMTPTFLKGVTFNRLYLDSFALAPYLVQTDMVQAFTPMMAHKAKIILASVPNGKLNAFYNIWTDTSKPNSSFKPFKRTVNDLPYSDAQKKQLQSQVGIGAWKREYLCEFI